MSSAPRRPLRAGFLLPLLAGACEPASASTVAEVPSELVLTADEPVAAFEVRLCVVGEPPHALDVSAHFDLQAFTNEGSVELTLESLEADPEVDGHEAAFDVRTVQSDDGYSLGISLVAEADWGSSGMRCAAPEVVQISGSELARDQVVNIIGLEARGSAQWSERGCGGGFDEDWLQIEVERL